MTKQGKKRASKKKREYSKTEALLQTVLSKRQKQEVGPARAEAQGVPEGEDPPPPPYAEVAPPGHWIPSPPWPQERPQDYPPHMHYKGKVCTPTLLVSTPRVMVFLPQMVHRLHHPLHIKHHQGLHKQEVWTPTLVFTPRLLVFLLQ